MNINEIKEYWSNPHYGERHKDISDRAFVDIKSLLDEVDRQKEKSKNMPEAIRSRLHFLSYDYNDDGDRAVELSEIDALMDEFTETEADNE